MRTTILFAALALLLLAGPPVRGAGDHPVGVLVDDRTTVVAEIAKSDEDAFQIDLLGSDQLTVSVKAQGKGATLVPGIRLYQPSGAPDRRGRSSGSTPSTRLSPERGR